MQMAVWLVLIFGDQLFLLVSFHHRRRETCADMLHHTLIIWAAARTINSVVVFPPVGLPEDMDTWLFIAQPKSISSKKNDEDLIIKLSVCT
jgi:hypothetical protein